MFVVVLVTPSLLVTEVGAGGFQLKPAMDKSLLMERSAGKEKEPSALALVETAPRFNEVAWAVAVSPAMPAPLMPPASAAAEPSPIAMSCPLMVKLPLG